MTAPYLTLVKEAPVADIEPVAPFFLIVVDHDRRFFCIEGPMTNDQPWENAARHARDNLHRRIVCGPAGSDRDTLAARFQGIDKLTGVPPGSIIRPRFLRNPQIGGQ